jgi:hypothetical protein
MAKRRDVEPTGTGSNSAWRVSPQERAFKKRSDEWVVGGQFGEDALSFLASITDKRTRDIGLRIYAAMETTVDSLRAAQPHLEPPHMFAEPDEEDAHSFVIGVASSGARAGVILRAAHKSLAWFFVSHSSVGGSVASGEGQLGDAENISEMIARLVMERG